MVSTLRWNLFGQWGYFYPWLLFTISYQPTSTSNLFRIWPLSHLTYGRSLLVRISHFLSKQHFFQFVFHWLSGVKDEQCYRFSDETGKALLASLSNFDSCSFLTLIEDRRRSLLVFPTRTITRLRLHLILFRKNEPTKSILEAKNILGIKRPQKNKLSDG